MRSLSAKQATQIFNIEENNFMWLNDTKVREQNHHRFSNYYTSFENLDDSTEHK
jgi:hypothetical protein